MTYTKFEYLEDCSLGLTDAEICSKRPISRATLVRRKIDVWDLRGFNRQTGSGGKLTGKMIPCPVCKTPVYNIKSRIQEGNSKCCSRKCSNKSPSFISKLKSADKTYMQTEEYSQSLRKPYTSALAEYRAKVYRCTKVSYRDNIDTINPQRHPRRLCGVPGGWQLDHIISIKEGFERGLSPERIGSVENLQMLPWKTNLLKSSGA